MHEQHRRLSGQARACLTSTLEYFVLCQCRFPRTLTAPIKKDQQTLNRNHQGPVRKFMQTAESYAPSTISDLEQPANSQHSLRGK
ncbi:hypothetical protein RvY_07211 [Ramazzottius varieornatus]|uniref:Uncharacterized protein n=1 Tax=Ramazzottius varieornatus TaxID=947166 RepID=A0A1D1V6E2_RAMVA|nr:hypothetical protein RvY_07211 [Ramazzottius varieornatus]